MDFPQRAVFFLEEDSSLPAHSKPLMLEAVLFCPILKWMSDKLLADGVQRFFAVSSPRFAQEVRACFPEDADVTISEQHSELLDFLNTPDPVAVFVRAALPMEEAGPGFVYGAAGYELQAVWQEKMTNAVSAAELIPGWVPVFSLETVAELSPCSGSGSSGGTSAPASGCWTRTRCISTPGSPSAGGPCSCPAPSCGGRPPSAAAAPSVPMPWCGIASSAMRQRSMPPR